MEAKLVYEKRKRLFPSLLRTGGFDTSSLDSTLGTKPAAKIRRLDPSRPKFSGRNEVLSGYLVKDLRSHRIFSPNSELYKELSRQKLGFEYGFDDSEDDSKAAKSKDISRKGWSISEQTGKIDLGFPILGAIDVFDEKCTGKTPSPEAEVSADPGTTQNCGNGIGIGKPSKGNARDKMDSDFKTKPFLRPCFRAKVFKTPGSLSYRRLLPYLMDISKTNSGEGENDRFLKLDKVSEEKPQAMQDSQSEEASKDGVDKNRILLECPELDKVSGEKKPQAIQALQNEEASNGGIDENTILVEFPELDKVSEEKQPQATQASQSDENSKDGVGKKRILVECPELDKVPEEKQPRDMQTPRSEEASQDGVSKSRISVEFQNLHYHTIVQGCAIESSKSDKLKLTSSENVSLSPSTVEAEECWSMPLVDDLQNIKVGLSCKDQTSSILDNHMPIAVKDLQVARKDENVSTVSDDNKPVEYVGTIENHICFPCNDQNSDNRNTEEMKSLDVEGHKPNQINDQRGPDDDEVRNQSNNLNEESNQMTPPDVEILGKPELEGNEADGADNVLQNGDPFKEKITSRVNHGNASLDYNMKHESNSKCSAVLKSRSRMKLFRSPGSLSYKRMLPFLKNIAIDDSANGHYSNPQKDLERPSPLSFDNLESPSDKLNGCRIEERQKDHSAALQMAVQTSVTDLSKDKENEISPEHGSEIRTSLISQKEDPLPIKEAVSSTPTEMETSPKQSSLEQVVQDTGRPFASLCLSSCESSSNEELSVSNSNPLSVETEGDLSRSALKSSDGVKSVEEDKFCYATPQTTLIPFSSVTPGGLAKKGILKRNPRGCRGLCTCLNCALFRLHAERGFEFSRNQMEDAEELVLDLLKELSYLRNVLEKSADAADNHLVNVNQVKEACRKASEAEEHAKDRLNQMNYDLGIHSRIPCLEPPRVRFANRVEENLIPKATFRSKKVLKHEK